MMNIFSSVNIESPYRGLLVFRLHHLIYLKTVNKASPVNFISWLMWLMVDASTVQNSEMFRLCQPMLRFYFCKLSWL